MRCDICGELVADRRFRVWNRPHWKTSHPEYVKWVRHWFRLTLWIGVPPLVASCLSIYYRFWADAMGQLDRLTSFELAFLPLISGAIVFSLSLYGMKKRVEFRSAWQNEQSLTKPRFPRPARQTSSKLEARQP